MTIGDPYTCTKCGETFLKASPEEKTEEELHENFGDVPLDKCALVCDDCYKIIMGGFN